MADYRLYCLDGAGRISLAEWIDAADDEAAVAKARELHGQALKCEIWRGQRLVASLGPGGGDPPASAA
jgi:hypothetical protein